MPSIIGSSLLSGNVITGTGPIGYSGPTGPTGPRGATGTVLGPTGGTAVYIFDVISNPSANQISFVLSDGNQYGPFFGFTGPTISYSDSRGLCAEHTSTAFSVWSGISAGITFQFRGITGDGQYITPSLTTDKNELLLTIGNLSAAGTPAYGNTGDDFISYTTPIHTATNTQIKVINQNFEESASEFAGSTDTTALEFGLTGIAATSASKVRVYSDFETPYINISPITRGNSSNPNGYTLDLTKSSVFKMTTPVGIASFSDTNLTNAYKSWLFFIEGSDVWNLPNNLLFDSGITGIGNYGFTPGMNLLRITKSPNSNNYIGTFIDRFIGADDTAGLQFGGIGSCCKPDGTCQDYTTQEECAKITGSYYAALKSCSQSCNIGSCCINGICYNNINRDTCLALTGNASAWSGNACSLGEGGICAPGTNVYQLTNSYTINQNPILLEENNVKLNDTLTWVKIYEFTVTTDDATAKISIDDPVNNNGVGCKFTLDPNNIVSQKTVSNIGTSIVSVYFAGFTGVVPDTANNQLISWNIRLTTATGSATSYNAVPNSLTYNNLKIIKKIVPVNKIQAYFKAQRYCLDCYGLKDIGSGDFFHVNAQTDKRKYYPIQEQYGTCLFSLTSTNDAINLLSLRVGDVREVNDCKFSDAETEYYSQTNPITSTPRPTTKCPHIDFNFDPTGNRAIGSNYCKTVRQSVFQTSGILQGYTPRYSGFAGLNAKGDLVDLYSAGSVIGATSPYWFDITFNDQHSLISNLSASSVITEANMKSVLDDLKNKLYSTSNTNGSLFFNKTNFNSALTVVPENSSCAPGVTAQHADLYNITLDFTSEPAGAGTSYKYFLHSFKTTYAVECINSCQKVTGGTNTLEVDTIRNVNDSKNKQVYLHSDGYYLLHKVIVKFDGNINNTTNPGEFLVFPMGSCKDKGFFVRDCISPTFNCNYTYMDTSTPKYVGEILPANTINNKLVVNVSRTTPAELLDTCHTADCLQYMNYQGLTYGLNENQFVSVNCSDTAPVSTGQDRRLQYEWWAYNYFLAPKICGGNSLPTYQWQSTPSGCNSLPSLVPPIHQFDQKASRFCYNYNQTTTSNRIASYIYTQNSSGSTLFNIKYYGWNDASFPNWTVKTPASTYTNRTNQVTFTSSISNDSTAYPAIFVVIPTSNSITITNETTNLPFNKAFYYFTAGANNSIFSPTTSPTSLPTGITAPVLIDKYTTNSKRNLPEIFFNLTPRVTTTTPVSDSYFDFTITPSSEYDCTDCLDWEFGGRITTVYLPLTSRSTIIHIKDFGVPQERILSDFIYANGNSASTLKFSDFAASAKDGNDVLLTVNVIQMFYRKNAANVDQNRKWVEKTRTFRIKYPSSGLMGSTSTTTQLPVATQLKRITNLVGDSQCVSINCETSPYLCLSLENC